uniref:Uncharacterized protein n=1 Tax=Solanum lycopersicum TaxID=4081 RepID=A0A3Q7IB52_SOLLC
MRFTMKILLYLLTVILFIAGTVLAGDYVRPPPRKTLHFPWDPKPSSQPQQICYSCYLKLSKYLLILICKVIYFVYGFMI